MKLQLTKKLASIFLYQVFQSTCMPATLDKKLSEKFYTEFLSSWVMMLSGSTTSETKEPSSECTFLK